MNGGLPPQVHDKERQMSEEASHCRQALQESLDLRDQGATDE